MVATNGRIVTVFGGTGFLGRHIVGRLRSSGFPVRIASRNSDWGRQLFGPDDPQLQSVGADIHDKRSVEDALSGGLRRRKCGQPLRRARTGNFSIRSRRGCPTDRSSIAPGRTCTTCSRFRNWCRCCITIPLHPKARRRRAGSPGRVRGCSFRSPGCDVRTRRRISHYHPEAASAAPNLSNVGPGLTRLQPAYVGKMLPKRLFELRGAQTHSLIFEFGGPCVYSYENFSEPLRIKLISLPYRFQFRLPFGTHWHGPPKCCRLHSSLAIRCSSCRSTP